MPHLTSPQREEIIRTLIGCGYEIGRAQVACLGLEGFQNFDLARVVIRRALQLFESNEYPQEAALAVTHLQTTRFALQEFNNGVAASSICAVREKIAAIAQQLESGANRLP